MPIPGSDQPMTGVPSGAMVMAGVDGSACWSIGSTGGPTRTWMVALRRWPAASRAVAVIRCVPVTRFASVREGPVPIPPMRFECQMIDAPTSPSSGSFAVALSVTAAPGGIVAPAAGDVIWTCGPRSPAGATAAPASRTPPVATRPASAASGWVVSRRRSRTWATVQPGCAASTSAATPATWGAAIDVPSRMA